MATAPQKKPAPGQGVRPVPQAAPPDIEDVANDDSDELDDLYQVFQTETVAHPPIKHIGHGSPNGLKLPFDKLTAINQWFLLPPFAVDKEAMKKEKQRIASYVYKKHKEGKKFKLIEIDERFANDVKRPELKGRYGVWRVA